MYSDEQVGQRIKLLRKALGLNQQQMAERFEMSFRAYQNREQGQKAFPVSELVILADLFDVSLEYLVFGKESNVSEKHKPEQLERFVRYFNLAAEEDQKFVLQVLSDSLANRLENQSTPKETKDR